MPVLKFYQKNDLLFSHSLHSRLIIGRSDRCDVSLPGADISRKHCIISLKNNLWTVKDYSKHGTLVNGIEIDTEILKKGSVIQILNYRICFEEEWETNQATDEVMESEEHLFVITADQKIHTYSADLIVQKGEEPQRKPSSSLYP